MDEILLSRIFALKVQADAINAELMAMSTDNAQRKEHGCAQAYGCENFQHKSDELQGIADELNQTGRG
ncbi:hypothetical protein KAR91_06765 [Candidatus Pacearchaeota archaeon]|nr:hypothetical protein [Candidatus Pacearchaeota archaeon]